MLFKTVVQERKRASLARMQHKKTRRKALLVSSKAEALQQTLKTCHVSTGIQDLLLQRKTCHILSLKIPTEDSNKGRGLTIKDPYSDIGYMIYMCRVLQPLLLDFTC